MMRLGDAYLNIEGERDVTFQGEEVTFGPGADIAAIAQEHLKTRDSRS